MMDFTIIEDPAEKDQFVFLYETYRNFLWHIAYRVLGDRQLAEDAVQEAYFAVSRHMKRIDGMDVESVRKFLATIAKNKAIDLKRKQKPETAFPEDYEMPDQKVDLLNDYINRESYETLVSCVKALDPIYRVTFEYKFLHHLSDFEIADLLGITPKAANVRYFRARKKLQELLAKEGHKDGK